MRHKNDLYWTQFNYTFFYINLNLFPKFKTHQNDENNKIELFNNKQNYYYCIYNKVDFYNTFQEFQGCFKKQFK